MSCVMGKNCLIASEDLRANNAAPSDECVVLDKEKSVKLHNPLNFRRETTGWKLTPSENAVKPMNIFR